MSETLEKLGGLVTIVVAGAVLYLVSDLKPPIFVQIICAFAGSVICLIGIVFLFAEGSIFKDRCSRKPPKVK
jgi:hypothetical protein